jgi:hypothetical protein
MIVSSSMLHTCSGCGCKHIALSCLSTHTNWKQARGTMHDAARPSAHAPTGLGATTSNAEARCAGYKRCPTTVVQCRFTHIRSQRRASCWRALTHKLEGRGWSPRKAAPARMPLPLEAIHTRMSAMRGCATQHVCKGWVQHARVRAQHTSAE